MCPQASIELDSVSLASAVVGRVMGSPCGITASQLTASGVILPRSQKTSHLLKVMYHLTCCFNSTTLTTKGQ